MSRGTVWLSLRHYGDETIVLGVYASTAGAKAAAEERAARAQDGPLAWEDNGPDLPPGERAPVEFMQSYEARACEVQP